MTFPREVMKDDYYLINISSIYNFDVPRLSGSPVAPSMSVQELHKLPLRYSPPQIASLHWV